MANTLFNLLSPFGVPTTYVGRQNKGFIATPHSDTTPDGWGRPYYDSGNNPITPGTPGGDGNRRALGYSAARGWRSRKTPGTFFVGNTSWLGKPKPTAGKGNWVLTYYGPPSRYFPTDSFSYGTDDHHNDIYCEGCCVAVAPHPVLGAALRNAPGSATGKELVVICKNGAQDIVYVRPFTLSGPYSDGYTDTYRTAQMRMYHATSNPKGWRLLGSATCTQSSQGVSREVKSARTPWFFDATGTVAQCMREATITMDRGDSTMEHPGYVRYKMTAQAESAIFTTVDNESGFTYTTKSGVVKYGDYSTVTRVPYTSANPFRTHWWKEYKQYMDVVGSGTYVIAVDYRDTQEVLLTIELKARLTLSQWFYIGCDDDYDATIPVGQRNHGMYGGDLYKASLSSYVPTQQDGVGSQWLGHDVTYRVNCQGFDNLWLYRKLSGSRAEFDTGEKDANDPWLYFVFGSLVYLHYFSIPRPHMAMYVEEPLYQYNTRFYSETEQYFRDNVAGGEATIIMERQTPGVDKPAGGVSGVSKGWTYANLLAYWPTGLAEASKTYRVLDGRMPLDIAYSADEVNPYTFFTGWAYTLGEDWPNLPDLLNSISKNTRTLGIAEDSLGHFAISMEYTDHNGEIKYYNALDGDTSTLDTLTGAVGSNTRFFPLGES